MWKLWSLYSFGYYFRKSGWRSGFLYLKFPLCLCLSQIYWKLIIVHFIGSSNKISFRTDKNSRYYIKIFIIEYCFKFPCIFKYDFPRINTEKKLCEFFRFLSVLPHPLNIEQNTVWGKLTHMIFLGMSWFINYIHIF